MAKLSISRLPETSKLLATKSGQELQDLISYVNDLADQTLRAIRQGLTLQDNFKCEIVTATLTQDTEQVINYTKTDSIVWVVMLRVFSTSIGIDGLAWWKDNSNQLVVKPKFTGSPTEAQTVSLAIFYQ